MNSPFFKSLKNQLAPDTSLDPDENAPTLKMAERPDWALFRSIEGLQQKAGVPAMRLRRLVLKEIADNALDTGTGIDAGQIDDHVIYVADNGPGLDGTPRRDRRAVQHRAADALEQAVTAAAARRARQRPAGGGWCRAGIGRLACRHHPQPAHRAARRKRTVQPPWSQSHAVDHPTGTRIEIGFGPALPRDYEPVRLGKGRRPDRRRR